MSHTAPQAESAATEEAASLRLIQEEMAGIFADLADLLGNPSSLGSIYGLLFASTEPLSMEEIVERLGVSTGTASQGLRRLGDVSGSAAPAPPQPFVRQTLLPCKASRPDLPVKEGNPQSPRRSGCAMAPTRQKPVSPDSTLHQSLNSRVPQTPSPSSIASWRLRSHH